VTVLRNGKETDVILPWIVKDIVAFSDEQRKAVEELNGKNHASPKELAERNNNMFYSLGFLALQKFGNGGSNFVPSFLQKINRASPGFRFWNTFEFIDNTPSLDSNPLRSTIAEAAQRLNLVANPEELLVGHGHSGSLLKALRSVPSKAFILEEAKTFPAYVSYEDAQAEDGTSTGAKKFVGYILIHTFSPGANEETVLAEVSATLARMQTLGVRDLIIDTLNNGGGSLSLGMRLAQLFSNQKVVQPEIQFKLSETWLDNFEQQSLTGSNDLERELGRRAYRLLKEERDAGKILSSRFPSESLLPHSLEPNLALENKMNIVVLINEMCASMCDIFAGIMQDNKLATIMGSQSMGAGGNVVEHSWAPNSGLAVRQTESLIISPSGRYLENNGIVPDVTANTIAAASGRFGAVIQQARTLLLRSKQPTPMPAAVVSQK
jgi:hypothetical protein